MQQPIYSGDQRTHEFHDVLHPPLVDRWGGRPGEPGRSSPDTPGPAVPKGLGAGAASLGAALMGTPKPAPCITMSRSEPLVSSLGWGPTPSTSMLVTPSDAPSTPGISCTGASHASNIGSSGAGGSHGTTTGRGEPGGTMTWSPALAANDATRGKYGYVTGRAVS
jgi:hypothetical protein